MLPALALLAQLLLCAPAVSEPPAHAALPCAEAESAHEQPDAVLVAPLYADVPFAEQTTATLLPVDHVTHAGHAQIPAAHAAAHLARTAPLLFPARKYRAVRHPLQQASLPPPRFV